MDEPRFLALGGKLLDEIKLMNTFPGDGRRIEAALFASEKLTIALRKAYEASGGPELAVSKKPPPEICRPAGSIHVLEYGWLHIQLNFLLPHCQFAAPAYLHDTLTRLLQGYSGRHRLPFFQKALLVIDEWSNLSSRQVYDQDNKGWKAIPNALKGAVIQDDDQYDLDIALLSHFSPEAVCHIYVLDAQEADAFFTWRNLYMP